MLASNCRRSSQTRLTVGSVSASTKVHPRSSRLCCDATAFRLPRLKPLELLSSNSLYQLNEVLQQNSAYDIRTMAVALRKLAYMGSEFPKGFKMLGMHERVLELCHVCQYMYGSVSPVIDLEDASDALGSLEDLVGDFEELHAEHDSIQACVQALTIASVSNWECWYSPDRPCDHTSLTSVLVAAAALSLEATPKLRTLAELTASALQSNFECSAMRSPAMTPTSDVVDLIEAFSRIFGVRKACADDSRDQPAAHMSLHTCSTHTMPFNGVGRGQVDKKHISESNMKLDVNDRTENVPAWPEYERVPAEVRAFVNTACEELEMRILPAVHSIHPPAKPEHIVSLLCGLADLKISAPAGPGCTDAALTLLKYRLKQGLVTSMCPYPYTISSVSDMAAVAEALVRLEHSGILVDEVVSMMLLTLAKVWAIPPGSADSMDAEAGAPRVSRDRTVAFCGVSVVQLMNHAVALGVTSIPLVFQLACEPHWVNLSQKQTRSEHRSSNVDEALATLPDAIICARLHTSDALVSCISRALIDCNLPVPVKARNLLRLAVLSPTGSHHVRRCLNAICETEASCEWNHLSSQYGADTAAVVLSDLLDAALCIRSQQSEVLAVAAADFLDSKRETLHAACAQQLDTCLRLADVQHSTMSCAITRVVSEKSAVAGTCEPDKDPLQLLPLSMCPVCLGQQGTDILQQSFVVIRRLMQVCEEFDRCQSFDVRSWEDALKSCNTSDGPANPTGGSDWNHQVVRVFSCREPWMQNIAFVESTEAERHSSTTAIVLAPHLQNPVYSQNSQTSSKCWSPAECSSLGGPMGRIGVMLQAVGIPAVAIIVRDWMTMQAMTQQKAGASELRQVVDEALLFAAKRRAL